MPVCSTRSSSKIGGGLPAFSALLRQSAQAIEVGILLHACCASKDASACAAIGTAATTAIMRLAAVRAAALDTKLAMGPFPVMVRAGRRAHARLGSLQGESCPSPQAAGVGTFGVHLDPLFEPSGDLGRDRMGAGCPVPRGAVGAAGDGCQPAAAWQGTRGSGSASRRTSVDGINGSVGARPGRYRSTMS